MKPILYESNATNFFNLGLGVLSGCKDVKVTEGANAEFYLEMKFPMDSPELSKIKNNRIIKADAGHELKAQQFEIKKISKPIKGFVEVYAEHVSYKARDIPLRPDVTVNGTAQNALQQWQNSFIGSYKPFTVSSNITTSRTTSWNIRDVKNAREALGGVEGSILDTWGGEYKFDNYHISLFRERGRRANAMIAYGRNLKDFEQEESILNTYTSIYPYASWADADGKDQLITADGFIVDSDHVNKYPNRKVLPVDFTTEFERDEKPTSARLIQLAKDYIKNNDVGIPSVSIRLTHLDLSQTLDYSEYEGVEEINLFDSVMVKFLKIGVDVTAKVVRVVWNVLLERYDEIEIGNVRASLSDRLNTIAQTVKDAKKEANEARTIAVLSANGINMTFFGPVEPTATKIGDTWYQEDGTHTILKIWDGIIWRRIFGTDDKEFLQEEIEENNKLVAEASEAAADAKIVGEAAALKATTAGQEAAKAIQQADATAADVRQSVIAAGFTTLADLTADMRTKTSQAQSNATSAINRAAEMTSELSGVKGSVSAIDVRINSISGTLDLKANTAEINRIDGTLSSIDTQLSVQAGEIATKVTQAQVNTAINDIQIGGRNLLRNSPSYEKRLTYTAAITDGWRAWNDIYVMLEANTTYTISYKSDKEKTDTHTTQENTGKVSIWIVSPSMGSLFLGSGRTFKTPNTNERGYIRTNIYGSGNTASFWDIQVEKGNKATDWSPAPEDMASITYVSSEIKQSADTISATISSLDGRVSTQQQTLNSHTTSISTANGNISTLQQNVNGLQSTVSGSNGLTTQVSQLSSAFNVVSKQSIKNLINVDSTGYVIASDWSLGTNVSMGSSEGVGFTVTQNINSNEENSQSRIWYRNFSFVIGNTYTIKVEIISGSSGENITIGQGSNPNNVTKRLSNGVNIFTVTLESVNINTFAIYFHNIGTYRIRSVVITEGGGASTGQLSVLNNAIDLAVSKGDVIGRITTQAGRVLIGARSGTTGNVLMVTPTTTYIQDATIKNAHIADLAVNSAKIADAAITRVKIGNAAIGTANIGDGVITNAKIGDLAVTAAKIQDATITSAKMINLDVSKIVGNTSNFVTSAWNQNGSDVRIDSAGIVSTHSSGRRIVYSSGAIQFQNSANERYQLDAATGFKGLNFYPMNSDYSPNGLAISGKGTNMISLGRDEADDGYEWRFEQIHAGELKLQSKHSQIFRMLLGASSQYNEWAFYNSNNSGWGALSFGNVRLSLNPTPRTGGGAFVSAESTDGSAVPMRASAFNVTSDRALKENICQVYNALDILNDLKVYNYLKEGKEEIGFIADEVPEILKGSDSKTVSMYDTLALTVKSVQEIATLQKEQNQAVQAKVISLEAHVKGTLEARLVQAEIKIQQLETKLKQQEEVA